MMVEHITTQVDRHDNIVFSLVLLALHRQWMNCHMNHHLMTVHSGSICLLHWPSLFRHTVIDVHDLVHLTLYVNRSSSYARFVMGSSCCVMYLDVWYKIPPSKKILMETSVEIFIKQGLLFSQLVNGISAVTIPFRNTIISFLRVTSLIDEGLLFKMNPVIHVNML